MAHRQAPGQYKEEPGHDSVSHILLRLHTFPVTNIALSTAPRKTWRVWGDPYFMISVTGFAAVFAPQRARERHRATCAVSYVGYVRKDRHRLDRRRHRNIDV